MRAAVLVVCLSTCLGGCYGWEQRHGIDPVINPAAVELSTSNQIQILTALAKDASIQLGGPVSWYEVTQAGFNFVDDECRAYFDAIFFLNRDKDQIKSGLAAAGATTAAILGVTGASAKSIAIVAEAFGLGIVSTDLVAGTYLYQMPPSVAQGFVKEMQLAYRDGAASRRAVIITPTAAYHVIQGYLALCLPPTIEAKIAEHVSSARAVADPPTQNGDASIGLTLTSTPTITRTLLRSQIIRNVDAQLSNQIKQQPRNDPTLLTNFEKTSLSSDTIKSIQTALCVTPADGNLGAAGSNTRVALKKYLNSDRITPRVWELLQEKYLENTPPTRACDAPAKNG